MAPSHLSSATSRGFLLCTNLLLDSIYFLDRPPSIDFTLNRCAFSFFQLLLSLRYLSLNTLTGTIPPQLGLLTQLDDLCAQNLILSPIVAFSSFPFQSLSVLSYHYCCSLRDLSSNELTGTIPLQLGNTLLSSLYAQNCLASIFWQCISSSIGFTLN